MPAFDRRVAVLMGGWTSEAAVSRVSASFCSKAARLAGWDAIEVELTGISLPSWKIFSLTASLMRCMARLARMALYGDAECPEYPLYP